jgi:hypothetical protein
MRRREIIAGLPATFVVRRATSGATEISHFPTPAAQRASPLNDPDLWHPEVLIGSPEPTQAMRRRFHRGGCWRGDIA